MNGVWLLGLWGYGRMRAPRDGVGVPYVAGGVSRILLSAKSGPRIDSGRSEARQRAPLHMAANYGNAGGIHERVAND